MAAELAELRIVFVFGDESALGGGAIYAPAFLADLPGETAFLPRGSTVRPEALPTVYEADTGTFSGWAVGAVEKWLVGRGREESAEDDDEDDDEDDKRQEPVAGSDGSVDPAAGGEAGGDDQQQEPGVAFDGSADPAVGGEGQLVLASFSILGIDDPSNSTPTISWEASAPGATYDLYVSHEPDCAPFLWRRLALTETSSVSVYLPDGTYYACVTAHDGQGNTLEADNNGFAFTIDVLPPGAQTIFASYFKFTTTSDPNPRPPFNSVFGSAEAADFHCTRLASDSGRLPAWDGTSIVWRAILSTDTEDARDRIEIGGPVYSTHGELVAQDDTEFWSGSLTNAVGYTAFDTPLEATDDLTWTGSNANGTANLTCASWGDPNLQGIVGRASLSNSEFMRLVEVPCSFNARLYCISP